jgi:hypothetical protein
MFSASARPVFDFQEDYATTIQLINAVTQQRGGQTCIPCGVRLGRVLDEKQLPRSQRSWTRHVGSNRGPTTKKSADCRSRSQIPPSKELSYLLLVSAPPWFRRSLSRLRKVILADGFKRRVSTISTWLRTSSSWRCVEISLSTPVVWVAADSARVVTCVSVRRVEKTRARSVDALSAPTEMGARTQLENATTATHAQSTRATRRQDARTSMSTALTTMHARWISARRSGVRIFRFRQHFAMTEIRRLKICVRRLRAVTSDC